MRQTNEFHHDRYWVRAGMINARARKSAQRKRVALLSGVVISVITAWTLTISVRAQRTPPPPIIGTPTSEARIARWDLTVSNGRDKYPAWLEVERSGFESLVGRFVGQIGGARPIGKIEWSGGVARFSIPAEWESRRPGDELRFEGRLEGDSLVGTIAMSNGAVASFVGKRAPGLMRDTPKNWSPPVTLFNGKDLSGWTPAPTAGSLPSHWTVRDGVLVNSEEYGANLMTVEKFQDFKLHAEFRLSKAGVAGIFPRGRYWVILSPKLDPEPFKGTTGAVHRFIVPNENASLGPDVWQAIDITLVGRRITVVINGKTVIGDQIIPGITGSAIDSDETAPGPIMLQGEERRVEFRKITISVPREPQAAPESCAAGDNSAAVAAVRARLAEWVRQANANDTQGMNEVWAPKMVGWFPRADLFSTSAAYAVARLPYKSGAEPRTAYDLVIDEVIASGPIVVVHDLWTQTLFLSPSKRVKREIRGSELWRCQPDGHWRIARYVSAPEPWTLVVPK